MLVFIMLFVLDVDSKVGILEEVMEIRVVWEGW